MNIRDYRTLKNLTQPQLAKELQEVAEGIDAPLISKMEKGLCDPPEEVIRYINRDDENLTQRDRVLKYIKDFGGITSWDAYRDLGITQLATRIFELKERGYQFNKTIEYGKNRYGKSINWCKYTLKENQDG